ncbi:DEAD/DEAH box helicase [Bacillus shivajii]|uniref:DEAD/DEAH box helicase n=1 Tax=Bacillus shivajii TaxID=1983719 RepID=UPI001CF9C4E5|nr:DEAD/DEAH box helicase [Bacillus shivajii]UCZ53929.1 DEAD/DEAH box helicase [Bacillus shivajii]
MNIESFESFHLSKEIRQALSDLNYEQPTEVQQKVIPPSLNKKDLVVKSQTGSGKTASFGIPVCELTEWEENKPQTLILTPTRELAVQVKEDITNIGRYKRVKAAAVFGKQPFNKQKLELKQKTHVVVGTPGRVLDHIEKGTLPIEKVTNLIIDEADEMFNMGFIDQVEAIIKELPTNRTTSIFSATIPEDVENLRKNYMKNPDEIEVTSQHLTTDSIDHTVIETTENKKFNLLKDVMTTENPDSCIIFCNTQESVDHIFRQLNQANYPCEKIHGGLYQKDRFAVMDNFKRGKFRYLIATDVAARGIDIESISLVINYDVPFEKESYVHRTGRTGRAGKHGNAISFVTPVEKKDIQDIESYIGFSIPIIQAPSKEEVSTSKAAFEEKLNTRSEEKKDKSAKLNENIMKLYFNGGKKKKLRPVDFVGTITSIPDVTADDIGIISIEQNATFIDILNDKGSLVLQEMKNKTVKGKKLKVYQAKK